MSTFFFCTLIWTLCVVPAHAFWLPGRSTWNHFLRSESLTFHKEVASAPDASSPDQSSSASANTTTPYVFSVAPASIITPTPTSQGMIVTSIVPIYEVCDMPGKNTTSCSTAYETVTKETCSTVLTYAFSKTTISDCTHNITFSSQTTYALATTTMPVAGGGPQARDAASVTPSSTTITYIQSTVSYYAAPWQSLAADTPTGITVLICAVDYSGTRTCVLIEEIWVVHTEYVSSTTTSTLSLSTSFSSDVVLLLGPTQSLVASAGNFTLSTLVEYPTMSPNATTSTSILTSSGESTATADAIFMQVDSVGVKVPQTSTTRLIRTITATGDTSTITKTLSLVGEAVEPTTTYYSTTTLTSTITVRPTAKVQPSAS